MRSLDRGRAGVCVSAKSRIEWTDATWSPVTGCSRVSEGCRHCYAERMTATRLRDRPHYRGLAVMQNGEARWTNEVRCHDDLLDEPLHWRKPRIIFVCSMSDLFHPAVPFEFIDRVFAVMAQCPQHTFQVLTKRSERMREYLDRFDPGVPIPIIDSDGSVLPTAYCFPLPNVWLGTSAEDQETLDKRLPHLLRCPAAMRFLSAEPLLGPIGLLRACDVAIDGEVPAVDGLRYWLHWVIAGAESGPGARPARDDWFRSLRDQCRAAGVPFFLKQRCDAKGRKIPFDDWPVDLRVKEMPAMPDAGRDRSHDRGATRETTPRPV